MCTYYGLLYSYLIESHDIFLVLNSPSPYTHPSPLIPAPPPLIPTPHPRIPTPPPLYPLPLPYTHSPSPSPYTHSPSPYTHSPCPYNHSPSPYTCSPSPYTSSPSPYTRPQNIYLHVRLHTNRSTYIKKSSIFSSPLLLYALTLEGQMWYKDITHHKPHDTSCNTLNFIHASMYPPPR